MKKRLTVRIFTLILTGVFLFSSQCIVKTAALSQFARFWQQRIRWATKTRAYKEPKALALLGFIYFLCFSVFILMIIGIFYNSTYMYLGVGILLYKGVLDYMLIRYTSDFFSISIKSMQFIPVFLFHWIYILVIPVAAISSTHYYWKGRLQH